MLDFGEKFSILPLMSAVHSTHEGTQAGLNEGPETQFPIATDRTEEKVLPKPELSPDANIGIIGMEDVRAEVHWLMDRVPIFKALMDHFVEDEQRINELLKAARINRHDCSHQEWVAGMAMAMARHFGLSDEERIALGLGAMVHDMGYMLPEGKTISEATKRDFDRHAADGALKFEKLFTHPDFKAYFDTWTEDQKRIAQQGIKYHNGGSSEEYKHHRPRIADGSKLVRAADKIHNMANRVFAEHLTPEIHAVDAAPEHRLAPASITSITVIINDAMKQLIVLHQVDRKPVQEKLGEYGKKQLLDHFRSAYGKAMVHTADVFADVIRWPATDNEKPVELKAVFLFEDGTQEMQTYRSPSNETA
jgi:hypothetical protein